MDYTLRIVLLGVGLIGAVAGMLGAFAFLRRQSLLGDAVAHCTLPGLALAFLLTGVRDPVLLLLGAAISGWLGAIAVGAIRRHTRLDQDAALALSLAVFFGFGLVLLTVIQRQPNAAQAGLDSFLFGQAAAMLARDLWTIGVLGLAAVAMVALLWRGWKLLSFDPEYAASLGWPMRFLEIALTTTLIVAVVIGLQSVGVVLISAMLVAPAAAARQWTDRFAPMVLGSAAIGAASAVVGAWIGGSLVRLPTGPSIVLAAGIVVLVSLALGSARGQVWAVLRRRRSWRHIRLDRLLAAIGELAARHDDPLRPVDEGLLRALAPGGGDLRPMLRRLERRGWLAAAGPRRWQLTPAGQARLAAARLPAEPVA